MVFKHTFEWQKSKCLVWTLIGKTYVHLDLQLFIIQAFITIEVIFVRLLKVYFKTYFKFWLVISPNFYLIQF